MIDSDPTDAHGGFVSDRPSCGAAWPKTLAPNQDSNKSFETDAYGTPDRKVRCIQVFDR